MGSYDVFGPKAGEADGDCPDVKGPAGAKRLTAEKIDFLSSLNAELNGVLASGAKKYDFEVAVPRITRLCEPSPDGLGPDLQGIHQPNAFHPTAMGMVRLAASVLRLIRPAEPN